MRAVQGTSTAHPTQAPEPKRTGRRDAVRPRRPRHEGRAARPSQRRGSMRLPLLCCVLLAARPAASASPPPRSATPQWRNGDVVLQTSASPQSAALQVATSSPYTHTGVVEVAPDGVFVIEALGRVSRTPIAAWIRRGDGRRYTALRRRDL